MILTNSLQYYPQMDEEEDEEEEEDDDEEEEDEVNNEGNPPPRKANLSVASKSMLGEIDRKLEKSDRKVANSVAKANERNAAKNKGAEVRYGKILNDT